MRRLASILTLCTIAACHADNIYQPTAPQSFMGMWELSTINGKPLPATLPSNPYLPIAEEKLWFFDDGGVQRERLLLGATATLPAEHGIARNYFEGIGLVFDNSNSPPFANLVDAKLNVIRGGDSLVYVRPTAN